MPTPKTELQTVVFLDDAREHAAYADNTQASKDAEWLFFNARNIVRAEAAGDANYVLELGRQRQERIRRIAQIARDNEAWVRGTPNNFPNCITPARGVNDGSY